MFKIPAWEADVPNNIVQFETKTQKTKQPSVDHTPKNLPTKAKTINKKPKQNTIKVNDASNTNKLKPQPVIPITNGVKRKHKPDKKVKQKKEIRKNNNNDIILDPNIDTDELIVNAKRKKFEEAVDKDDKEIQMLFKESNKRKNKKKKDIVNGDKSLDISINKNKLANYVNKKNEPPTEIDNVNKKKEKLRAMLANTSNRSHINTLSTSNKLRQRMLERLKAAQFRYLNEKLYTSSGTEAKQLFQSDPAAFHTYHEGYQQQLKKWPVNPLDVIVKKIKKMPKSHTIADLGCGEAALSKRVPQTVRSFDLVATAPGVEVCDMAHTPLLAASVDVAVYCLALMGTELTQYLVEANRILKMGGHLLIAEVESRFDKVDDFANEVQRLGFKLKELDKSNQVFYFMEFTKFREPPVKKSKLPALTLKPCLYKKR